MSDPEPHHLHPTPEFLPGAPLLPPPAVKRPLPDLPFLPALRVGATISLVLNLLAAAVFVVLAALIVFFGLKSGGDALNLILLSVPASVVVCGLDIWLLRRLDFWKTGRLTYGLCCAVAALQILVFPIGTALALMMIPALLSRQTRQWIVHGAQELNPA